MEIKSRRIQFQAKYYQKLNELIAENFYRRSWPRHAFLEDGPRLGKRLAQEFLKINRFFEIRRHSHHADFPDNEPFTHDQYGESYRYLASKKKFRLKGIEKGKCLFKFFLYFGQTFFPMIKNTHSRSKSNFACATLCYGFPRESLVKNGADDSFSQWLESSEVDILKNASLIIEHEDVPSSSPHVVYTPRPLLKLLEINLKGFKDYFDFIEVQLKNLFESMKCFSHDSDLLILNKDFAYLGVAHYLNRKQAIENIVITNSNFMGQSLWSTALKGKRFSLHALWYSLNNNVGLYHLIENNQVVHIPYPVMKNIVYDYSWYWNAIHARALEKIMGSHSYRIVRPTLFCSYQDIKPKRDQSQTSLNILVCDIFPNHREWNKKAGYIFNYYYPTHVKSFMSSLVEVVEELNNCRESKINLLVKNKDRSHDLMDRDYIEIVHKLMSEKVFVKKLDSSISIAQSVLDSDLVISIPFTSVNYIADYLDKKSVYYDPTGLLSPSEDLFTPKMTFLNSREKLKKYLQDLQGEILEDRPQKNKDLTV